MEIKLSDIAEHLSGQLIGQDSVVESVITDSRAAAKGALFVALIGERFDAHDFCVEVSEAGCVALVVNAPQELPETVGQIIVPDTLKALGEIGALCARLSTARQVALTGSCGKTTTKEMLKLALQTQGVVHATEGNLNNHIGVPLTLAALSEDDEFAVIEMGASGLDEIRYTVTMASPEVVMITNAHEAHLEGFGSLQNIVQAKGEIVRYAPDNARVVLNADDPAFSDWYDMAGERDVIVFGNAFLSDKRVAHAVTLVSATPFTVGRVGYDVEVLVDQELYRFQLHASGEHMVKNAMATLAVAVAMQLDISQVLVGLSRFYPVKGRLAPVMKDDLTVWDDSYNANPGSVKAAISAVEVAAPDSERWLVLGNMAEMGDEAGSAHSAIGRYAADHGITKVFAIGAFAKQVITGFEDGLKESSASTKNCTGTAYTKTDMDVLISDLKDQITGQKGLSVLVKGSRSAHMEDVVEALIND
jgi:UDP-N-acetylmuramoyl-tripeptide--D-alanyl-D-alanine ligase